MAQSPAHRFGQIVGNMLERAMHPVLQAVADELGLYLDVKGERKARGTRRKVAWTDGMGNTHDLDFVFEDGGTGDTVGRPRAFIEIAWRRYTKHSRNKAQEIQGAIMPLAERYSDHRPFLGAVLAGVFTEGSLNQLRSHGFAVLYFPYDSVVAAFAVAGIDARFDEDTPDTVLLRKVRAYERLTSEQREQVAAFLRDRHRTDVEAFTSALRLALTRKISAIYVLPLHGTARTLGSVGEAIDFIQSFDESSPCEAFIRYEVGIRFSNGDEVRGQFQDKASAVAFLRSLR